VKDLLSEFQQFDEANPMIWDYFVRFADEAIRHGRTRLSVSLIIERIRWEVDIVTNSEDDFKLNNNHRPYYARKWLSLHPEMPGFFETRRVRCEAENGAREWREEFDFGLEADWQPKPKCSLFRNF
jgi:hypothetical protein